MKNTCLVSTFLLMSNLASLSMAESYSNVSAVKGYTLGESYMRIKLESMKSVEGCADQDWYHLSTDTDGGRLKASSIMTSYVTQEPLFLQITSCTDVGSREYPKVTHVYQCSTMWCQ
jgi:hypothetical protein